MGIENFEKKKEVLPFEAEFQELKRKERGEIKEVKRFFIRNAEISRLLASDDELDMTVQQKRYYLGKANSLQDEAKEILHELRKTTGYEVPSEMQGLKAAREYYEEIRKAA